MKLPKTLSIIGVLLIVLAGGIAGLLWGYRWWWGLASPRSVKPEMGSTIWSPPAGSVGSASAVFEAPPEPPLPRDQAARLLTNPEPATPPSIERGKKAFGTYCAQCHGPEAHGDGIVAKKMLIRPPDLSVSLKRFPDDGYLYGTIRNGGVLMPPQGSRIPPAERWDLVNYLRSIQK